jgi:hypothetical protein
LHGGGYYGGYYGWGGYYPYWGWPYYSSYWGWPGYYGNYAYGNYASEGNASVDADADDGWSDREQPARDRADEGRADVRPGAASRPSNLTRLRLRISPDDAVVYLDDRYLGAGDDLAAYARGVVTEPGTHTISVVRPGFKTKTVTVTARAGSPTEVVVDLEK